MKLDDLTESAVFDPDTGFGGDGAGGCIQNGPFVNVTVNIGPGYQTTPTCLARSINRRANPLKLMNARVQSTTCMNYTTYEEVWPCLYGTPHLLGHAIMGSLVCYTLLSFSIPESCADPLCLQIFPNREETRTRHQATQLSFSNTPISTSSGGTGRKPTSKIGCTRSVDRTTKTPRSALLRFQVQ